MFRGSEAAELGLVNCAVEDELVLDVALEYARDVAANVSPASMATIKRQVYEALIRPLGDALEDANVLMLESFSKPDFAEDKWLLHALRYRHGELDRPPLVAASERGQAHHFA